MANEYTGQVKDGPEAGNLISASVPRWQYKMTTEMHVDGDSRGPAVLAIRGWYAWDESNGTWTFEPDRRFASAYSTAPDDTFDPDGPGCAPETCGGSQLDPCSAVLKTSGQMHDDGVADDMRLYGLDPSDRDLFRAVLDINGPANYLMSAGTDCRAADLCAGDAIFSDATGQWHEVKEAGTHNGATTIVIDRNNEQTFRFKVTPDTTFWTRLSEDHLTAIRFGAAQTIYSKGE